MKCKDQTSRIKIAESPLGGDDFLNFAFSFLLFAFSGQQGARKKARVAAFVQFVEMAIERFSPFLYHQLGVFLPLITVNCAILGASLFMVIRNYSFLVTFGYGLGSGIGWFLAIMAMAGIRQRLANDRIPRGLQGSGITLIIAGLMALAFIGFTGVLQGQ